jgi:UDP-N-acetylglucosamine--N-acetylmuramyl-(pentapeptide) pyrophosphoryl-undecaprenol N-acetylglucosamine transferase
VETPVSEILNRKRLLIIGGSQGAHAVNQIVMRAFSDGLQIPGDWEVVHQTGRADVNVVREFYQRHGITARVADFLTDMPAELSAAGIAISRAGAVSIQELACAGLPSILLPLSTSANDHQMCNARLLEQAAAVMVIDERHRSADVSICSALKKLLGQTDERQRLSNKIRTFAKPDATVETLRLLNDAIAQSTID